MKYEGSRMKIKKLYCPPVFPYNLVVETTEGKMMAFNITPARKITEKDLSPVPGFRAIGNNGTEAPDYMYDMYWLEKVSEEQKTTDKYSENPIREIRKGFGLTQIEFCKLTGVPYGTLQDWEQGKAECKGYIVFLIAYYLQNEARNNSVHWRAKGDKELGNKLLIEEVEAEIASLEASEND